MKEIEAAIDAAVAEHRRKLGELASCVQQIEDVDRQIDELTERRAGLVSTYSGLHSELASGKAAGDAVAALGLKAPAAVGGSRAKQPGKRSYSSGRKSQSGKGMGSGSAASKPRGSTGAENGSPGPGTGVEAAGAPAPDRGPVAV